MIKKDSKTYQNVIAQRDKIAQSFADAIDRGGLNWVKEWAPVNAGAVLMNPYNAATGAHYNGRNVINLAFAAVERGYDDPRWVTFAQAKANGWRVRKGEHAAAIVEHFSLKTWTTDDTNPDTGETVTNTHGYVGLDGAYSVFNACQVDGIPAYEGPAVVTPTVVDPTNAAWGVADRLISSSRCPVHERAQDEAFYMPGGDYIVLPKRSQFGAPVAFLGTLAHEMTHSTGDELGRSIRNRFGDVDYAREELVAELGSAFVLATLGYEAQALDPSDKDFTNHAAYLASWGKKVKSNPDYLLQAAGKANEAANYIVKRYEVAHA